MTKGTDVTTCDKLVYHTFHFAHMKVISSQSHNLICEGNFYCWCYSFLSYNSCFCCQVSRGVTFFFVYDAVQSLNYCYKCIFSHAIWLWWLFSSINLIFTDFSHFWACLQYSSVIVLCFYLAVCMVRTCNYCSIFSHSVLWQRITHLTV